MKYKFLFLSCFEGEGTDDTTGDHASGKNDISGDAGSSTSQDGTDVNTGQGGGSGSVGDAGNGNTKVVTFTQDQVNSFLKKDREKHQTQVKSLETSYQELLNSQNIGQEERERLEGQLEDLRKRHRTKEQQATVDRKEAETAYEKQLQDAKIESKTWEERYTNSTITTALQGAAIEHEAFNPQQIIVQLRPQTKLVDQLDVAGKPTGTLVPMVEMTIRNAETGATDQLQMTPSEAVEHMKKSPELWGNFFRNNVREGIGSTSATGGELTGEGTLDHTKLTDEQWFAQRKKDPALLGLRDRNTH